MRTDAPAVPNSTASTQSVPRLMRQLSSAVPTQKVQAAGQLAKLGPSAGVATDLLIACLDDTDPDVRLYCAYALAEVTSDAPRTLKALTTVLTDKNEHVRYSAEWSIAKIARSIDAQTPLTPVQLDSVRNSLEATLSRFSKQEHQPRHAIAIRNTLETLAARSATIATSSSQLKAELELKAKRDAIIALFAKQFHVGDRVQRLQLIEEVRAEHLDDAEITNEAMHCVLATGDYILLEFAISRWGDAGRSCAKKILLAVEDDKLPSWTTTLLTQIESSDRQLFERLLASQSTFDCQRKFAQRLSLRWASRRWIVLAPKHHCRALFSIELSWMSFDLHRLRRSQSSASYRARCMTHCSRF